MCGQLGWYITKPVRQLPPMAGVLEVLMDDRGEDSWGFYAYPFKDDKIQYESPIMKRGLGTLTENVPARSLRKFSMFLGHSRDASVGKVTVANSHPFEIGDIIGAHNGAIYEWAGLNKKYGRDYEVDSQHIFAHIDEDKSLSDLHGYGSIVFIRKSEPQRINLYRWNDNSVLAYADLYFKNGEKLGVAWASTKQALESAIYVSGLEFKAYEIEMNKKAWIIEPEAETGVPTMFFLEKNPYDFGAKHVYGNYQSGNYVRDLTTSVYCYECGVVDGPSFHSKGFKHNPSGAEKNLGLLNDSTVHLNADTIVVLNAFKKFKEDSKHIEGSFMGRPYKILYDDTDPVVTVELGKIPLTQGAMKTSALGAVTSVHGSTDSSVECALCGGPGPFKTIGRFTFCIGKIAPISCWEQWKQMSSGQKGELMTQLVDDWNVKEQKKQADALRDRFGYTEADLHGLWGG